MKKSILALLLAVLMVASLLPAAALADGEIETMAELQDALNSAQQGDTVTMKGDVTVSNTSLSDITSAVITVPAGVTLDGDGHKIIADGESWVQRTNDKGKTVNANHILGVSNGSTVKDLTIVGAEKTKSGIHAYKCTEEVNLINVTIQGCGEAGMIVNGSLVKATDLNTSGNAWGAVNVDRGSGVDTSAEFVLVSGNLSENTKIWSENDSNSTITVPEETWTEVNGEVSNDFAPLNDLGVNAVLNVTTGKYYRGLEYAVEQAEGGNELKLMGDVSVTSTITIDKSLTIDGNNNTITGNVDSDDNIQITAGDFIIMNAAVKDFGGNLGTKSSWGLFKVPNNADPEVSFTAYNLSVSNFNRGAFDINAGTFYIENCSIDCDNNSPEGKKLTKALLAGYDAEGTIKNCLIKNASSDYDQWAAGGIEVLDDASVTVESCRLENVQYGIYPYIYGEKFGLNASVIVKNTNIDASEYAICVGTNDEKGKASVTVESGNFKGGVTCVGEDGATDGLKITVNGGTFDTSVAKYVGNSLNYEVNNNGSYNYYPTLDLAIANAGQGAQIKNVNDGPNATMYSLVVDPDNGGKVISISVSSGFKYTLPTVTKSGYAFLGWACSDGKTYSALQEVTITANTTFTASWVRHPDTEYVPEPEEPVEPETPTFPFYDVPTSAWYYTAVKYVYDNKLMDGVDTYTFAPNDTLTRAMVWTIIARMSGVDTTGGNSWYAKAQEWVITNGISDGENPTAAITREQLVTMLYRYAQIKGYDVSVGENTNILSYVDATSISEYAMSAFQWACGSGLTEGDENGALTPLATATRAQAAAMIMRFLSK